MAKTKRTTTTAREESEEVPLIQEGIDSILIDASLKSADDEAADSVLEKFVRENRDLVVWVSLDPRKLNPFDQFSLGEYDQYGIDLYSSSRYYSGYCSGY